MNEGKNLNFLYHWSPSSYFIWKRLIQLFILLPRKLFGSLIVKRTSSKRISRKFPSALRIMGSSCWSRNQAKENFPIPYIIGDPHKSLKLGINSKKGGIREGDRSQILQRDWVIDRSMTSNHKLVFEEREPCYPEGKLRELTGSVPEWTQLKKNPRHFLVINFLRLDDGFWT